MDQSQLTQSPPTHTPLSPPKKHICTHTHLLRAALPPNLPPHQTRQQLQRLQHHFGRGRQQHGPPKGAGDDAREAEVVEPGEAFLGRREEEKEVVRGLRGEGFLHLYGWCWLGFGKIQLILLLTHCGDLRGSISSIFRRPPSRTAQQPMDVITPQQASHRRPPTLLYGHRDRYSSMAPSSTTSATVTHAPPAMAGTLPFPLPVIDARPPRAGVDGDEASLLARGAAASRALRRRCIAACCVVKVQGVVGRLDRMEVRWGHVVRLYTNCLGWWACFVCRCSQAAALIAERAVVKPQL